jgi:hypothetical protein
VLKIALRTMQVLYHFELPPVQLLFLRLLQFELRISCLKHSIT